MFNKVLCFAIPASASLVLPDGEIVAEERGTIQACVELRGRVASPVTLRIATAPVNAEGIIYNYILSGWVMNFC